MSTTSPNGTERRAYSKAQTRAGPATGCSFCWFVLGVYPEFKGMPPSDERTFVEHLTKVHGLKAEIEE